MKKKITVLTLCAMLFALCVSASAQQGKIPWIGYLAGAGSGPSPAFIQALRDLGYIEGKNIGFVFRTTESRSERSADLAAELVRLKVDVIVTDNTNAALALKKATSTIPIVMTTSTDPVGSGLIASFARHGGDITGLECPHGVSVQDVVLVAPGSIPSTHSSMHSELRRAPKRLNVGNHRFDKVGRRLLA